MLYGPVSPLENVLGDGLEYGESDGEADGEARSVKTLMDPKQPTKDEVEAHNVNHLPFRSWCPCCVQGKARNIAHRRAAVEEHQVPQIVVD